jgi:hypothetical protein
MDPWQDIALDVIFKEQANGKWAAREVAYLVGRQNGKGGILSAVCLAALFLFDDVREILFSAHEFKTAKKAYRDLRAIIKANPALDALVERRGNRQVGFRQSNEDTSITLTDGTVLRFMARSNNTARGFSPQIVIADEAQECSQDTRSALFYTIRAQANPLVIWCGTVPGPRNNGTVFKALRDRGRKGGDQSASWMEWSPQPDADPLSQEAIIDSTPGMPYRVTMETAESEREAALVDPEAFEAWMREALSVWPDDADTKPKWEFVPESAWVGCATKEPSDAPEAGWLTGTVDIGVEVSFDRSSASIGAAGVCREGGVGLEVIARGDGTDWIVPMVAALKADKKRPVARVVLDLNSPAGSLKEPLIAAGIDVTECGYADMKAMTGGVHDAILATEVVHRERPELTDAVGHASKRTSGDVELIDRRAGVDVAPFLACGLAWWAHHIAPEPEAYALVDYA